jgi:F0F1-type ATP synthase membrane subunit b/b'
MDVLNNLNVDLKLVLVNIIGFVILLVVAKKMVFDPIGKVVTERDSDISGQYDRLESAQREMEALKADYESRLTAIEAEAREKIQTAIKEAQAARDQILADANQKSHEIVSKAEAEAADGGAPALLRAAWASVRCARALMIATSLAVCRCVCTRPAASSAAAASPGWALSWS